MTQPPNILSPLKNEIRGFLEHIQSFYVEAALQIKKRFPINDEILKSSIILNPATINSTSSQEVMTIASNFPNIITPAEI